MENQYYTFNQTFLIITTLGFLLCMIIASIRIRNDKNDVLDEVEKLIFYVSTLQQLFYFAFLIDQLVLFGSGLRILRLISVFLICDCLGRKHSQRNISFYQNLSLKIKGILLLIVIGLWIILVLYEDQQFYCDQTIWSWFSTLTFFIDIINLYFGLFILSNINDYLKPQNMFRDQVDLWKETDLRKTKQIVFQIIIFELVSSTTLLFWDYQTLYENSQLYCIKARNFTENLCVLAMLIIMNQLPSIGFYFSFYRKNLIYLLGGKSKLTGINQ